MTINALPIAVPEAPDHNRAPPREPASSKNDRDDFTRTYDQANRPDQRRTDESTGAAKPRPSDTSSKEDAPVSEQPESIDGPVKASPVTTAPPEPPQATTPEIGKDPVPIHLVAASENDRGAALPDDAIETVSQPVIGGGKNANPWKNAALSLKGAGANVAQQGEVVAKDGNLIAGDTADSETGATSTDGNEALSTKIGAQTKHQPTGVPGQVTTISATGQTSSGASDTAASLKDVAKADKLDSLAASDLHTAKDKSATALGSPVSQGSSEPKAIQGPSVESSIVPSLSLQTTGTDARPVLTSTLSPLVTASAGGFAEPVRQIADAIRIHRADQSITVRLDPPELGSVSIDLSFDKTAKHVTAIVAAEQPDTASMLRRQLDSLQKELTQAGFSGVDVEFSGHADHGADSANLWFSSGASPSTLAQGVTTAAAPRDQNIISTTRIDARF
ncbi:MAG: flagellar hook-length control protein FliK [Parvularcula sp.]